MKVVIFASLVAAAFAITPKYTDCGSTAASITSVTVTPCTDPNLCQISRGTTASIAIGFLPFADTSKITASVFATLPTGGTVQFPLNNPDGCSNSGISCPVAAGNEVKYTLSLPMKTQYPDWKVDVKFHLKDGSGGELACVEMPIELTG